MGNNNEEIMRNKLLEILELKLSDEKKYKLIKTIVHKEYRERKQG